MRRVQDSADPGLHGETASMGFSEEEVVPFVFSPALVRAVWFDFSYPVRDDGIGHTFMHAYQIPQGVRGIVDIVDDSHDDNFREIPQRGDELFVGSYFSRIEPCFENRDFILERFDFMWKGSVWEFLRVKV